MDRTEAQKKLTPEQYNICFLKGTEPPGSGKFLHTKAKGMYVCVVCGQELFKSDTKFDSKTGWPSFWDPVKDSDSSAMSSEPNGAPGGTVAANVKTKDDYALGMHRLEVECSRCGSHLGHVFDDGPAPTGKRYCINSLALDFKSGNDGG